MSVPFADDVKIYDRNALSTYQPKEINAMKKLFMIVIPFLLMTVLLSGCKASDYDDAISALNDSNYEEAIELFASLRDYKDSANQFLVAINTYADNFIEKNKYDDAISIYEQYSDYGDFENIINNLKAEKEKYDVYHSAMVLLKEESYDDGFELLDTLPHEYRNIEKIYQSYDDLKDVPFKGTHTNVQGKNSQKIKFNLLLDMEKECFFLHAYKAVYYSDGTVYKDYEYYFSKDEINDNTIQAGKFTWRINDDGYLTESEKGTTALYS